MINIQNIDDNECLKWYLLRHLNTADRKPVRITKADKDFAKKLDFNDIKFPVTIRDIHKSKKKKNSTSTSASAYENEAKKCYEEKEADSL